MNGAVLFSHPLAAGCFRRETSTIAVTFRRDSPAYLDVCGESLANLAYRSC